MSERQTDRQRRDRHTQIRRELDKDRDKESDRQPETGKQLARKKRQ